MNRNFLTTSLLAIASSVLLATGCKHAHHQMGDPGRAQTMQCRLCYDESSQTLHLVRNSKSASYRNEEIRRHQCPDCKTEVVSYMQDGTPMIRCAKCAPDGLPCDRCLPPPSQKS